jgi:hypothetical protein
VTITHTAMTDTNAAPATPEPAASADTAPAPARAPAPDTAGHEATEADFDLLADDASADDGDDGASGAPAAGADAPRPPWQRPEGLEGDALAEWKAEQGLPTDAAGYEVELALREGETITEVGQQLIDGLKGFAVEHDLPPAAVNGLARWYDAHVKGLQAKVAEGDKTQRHATRDTLTQKWAGAYDQRMAIAKEGAKLFPDSVRAMLKVARTPDGRKVSDTPEFAEALLALGRLSQKGKPMPTSDDDRLAKIQNVMRTDISAYRAKGLDKEYLALMQKKEVAQTRPGALTAAEEAEERELTQLMHTDIGTYRHQMWRGTGRTAADRALQLARKRAGEAA